MTDIHEYVASLCRGAKEASYAVGTASEKQKNRFLLAVAAKLREQYADVLCANATDMENAARNGLSAAMQDRLRLTEERICAIADAVENVVALPDPTGCGEIFTRPNGLRIERVRVPLGVVGILYESRPNVTVDAAVLCVKSGNAVVLRGGKEAISTNTALAALMRDCAKECGFPRDIVCLIERTGHDGADALMQMRGLIDVLIPRGSARLINSVVENATVPVIETGAGNCHLYVDESADIPMAVSVAVNAKTSRPSVCNAVETILVHRAEAEKFLPAFYDATRFCSLEIRGCAETCAILPDAKPSSEEDWDTEYGDYIVAVKVVSDVEEAIAHIRRHTTHHSEAILTENARRAEKFTRSLDAAAVYVNASTRFTDGGEFGLGAEIGISTQKLHARGPMGLKALTTEKYIVRGDGQVR